MYDRLKKKRQLRHVLNIFLAGIFICLEKKFLSVFPFQTLLPYVFFLFVFALLEYVEEAGIKNLFRNITPCKVVVNFVLTVLLYSFYTCYEHKIYAVLWFVITIAVLLLSDAAVAEKTIPKIFFAGALFLALLSGIGWSFENSQGGGSLRRVLLNVLLLACCWFFLFMRCFLIGDMLLGEWGKEEAISEKTGRQAEKDKLRKCFFICFILNLAVWLPVFLTFYPAVFNSDPVDQMQNILGLTPYKDHHPWYYTLFMGLCYKTGYFLFGTVNEGIAVYTLLSMLFISASFAFAVTFLYQQGLKWYWVALIEALYAFDPIKAHHTMAAWKDIPFASLLLLLSIVLAEFRVSKKWFLLFCATALSVCLMRHNGIYILILLLPVLWFAWKENRKFLGKAYLLVLLLYFVLVKLIIPAAGVQKIGLVHSLSIPLQQIAYTVCEDGNINEEEYELIHAVADTDAIKEAYHDWNADYMKHLAEENEEVIEQNKLQYLKLWAELGMKNPYCYLKAYVEITKGYWFPTVDLPVRMGGGVTGEEIGMEKHPLLLSKRAADKIDELTWIYGCEIYPKVFCIGLWTYFSIAALVLLVRRKGYWLTVLPSLFCVATLLLAVPLYAEFRYAYPTYCFVPFGIGLLLLTCIHAKENA